MYSLVLVRASSSPPFTIFSTAAMQWLNQLSLLAGLGWKCWLTCKLEWSGEMEVRSFFSLVAICYVQSISLFLHRLKSESVYEREHQEQRSIKNDRWCVLMAFTLQLFRQIQS